MREVVIAGYLRTAQSRSRPTDPSKDWFGRMRADELLAKVMPELVKRSGIDAGEIDDFIVGCAQAVGEQVTFGGRFSIFMANFPYTVPAKLVDQQCGSSMAAIHMGFLEIATDNADIVMVGGMENMSRVPMGGATTDSGLAAPNLALFTAPEYRHWEMQTTMSMGLTAQKLLSQTDFTREDMDKWALRSHQLAEKAIQEGFFDGEIMPIEVEQADGSIMTVKRDQAVRGDTTLEALARLKPAFNEGHQITAGNSSPVNAAASAMILMSKEAAHAKGIKPLATIRSIGFAGVNPTIMGVGPVPASKKALRKAGLEVQAIDFWEINEAFCIVALNCIKELGIDPEKANVMGGGTAIGHPMGATGIRLVGTLARVLQEKGGRYGCANACIGGGQGVATVIERTP
ncbi:MAG: acetyl-CoA C-acetyltransferase [Desulfomonile tiedjei]|uniref:Acetyl-CoA C-acetyltransferase n=1 Tax=Desulfomonile tiedjei TaxID=2358 RepID=A0A9D6V9C4_9BACT|nr:acetyl-CoA C-acetyltransferase [Desulfomonile tiedjei]